MTAVQKSAADQYAETGQVDLWVPLSTFESVVLLQGSTGTDAVAATAPAAHAAPVCRQSGGTATASASAASFGPASASAWWQSLWPWA